MERTDGLGEQKLLRAIGGELETNRGSTPRAGADAAAHPARVVRIHGAGDGSLPLAAEPHQHLVQSSIMAVIALGMTFVIIGGGSTCRFGSTVALSGCIAALVMVKAGLVLGIVAGVAAGVLVGLLNGS
jgi:hypothetical protein